MRGREILEWTAALTISAAVVYGLLWLAIVGPMYLSIYLDRG